MMRHALALLVTEIDQPLDNCLLARHASRLSRLTPRLARRLLPFREYDRVLLGGLDVANALLDVALHRIERSESLVAPLRARDAALERPQLLVDREDVALAVVGRLGLVAAAE